MSGRAALPAVGRCDNLRSTSSTNGRTVRENSRSSTGSDTGADFWAPVWAGVIRVPSRNKTDATRLGAFMVSARMKLGPRPPAPSGARMVYGQAPVPWRMTSERIIAVRGRSMRSGSLRDTAWDSNSSESRYKMSPLMLAHARRHRKVVAGCQGRNSQLAGNCGVTGRLTTD